MALRFDRRKFYDQTSVKEKKRDEVEDAINFTKTIYNIEFTCVYCGVKYIGHRNLGRLECIRGHPGVWSGSEWTCCLKKSLISIGCRRHDHLPEMQEPYRFSRDRESVVVLQRQFQTFDCPPEARYESFMPVNASRAEPLTRIFRIKDESTVYESSLCSESSAMASSTARGLLSRHFLFRLPRT